MAVRLGQLERRDLRGIGGSGRAGGDSVSGPHGLLGNQSLAGSGSGTVIPSGARNTFINSATGSVLAGTDLTNGYAFSIAGVNSALTNYDSFSAVIGGASERDSIINSTPQMQP